MRDGLCEPYMVGGSAMRRVFTVCAAAALTISFGACGKSNSPTMPSSSASASASTPAPAPGGLTGGATIGGTVVRGAAPTSIRPMSGSSITVTVAGTSIATTVDPSGAFRLLHVPAGDDDLDFEGPDVHARLHVAGVVELEEIELRVFVAGGTADVDHDERHTADNRVEIEGRIAEVNAAARTLLVGNTLVMVPAGTPIRHGETSVDFAQLRVGDRVHAHATTNGTAITATEVMLQTEHGNPAPGEDHGNDAHVELNVTLPRKGGRCPSRTFTVSSTSFATNASRQSKDTAAGTLATAD